MRGIRVCFDFGYHICRVTAAPFGRSDGEDVLYGRRCSVPISEVRVVLYVEKSKGWLKFGEAVSDDV
jgi:hypothetical protein